MVFLQFSEVLKSGIMVVWLYKGMYKNCINEKKIIDIC